MKSMPACPCPTLSHWILGLFWCSMPTDVLYAEKERGKQKKKKTKQVKKKTNYSIDLPAPVLPSLDCPSGIVITCVVKCARWAELKYRPPEEGK